MGCEESPSGVHVEGVATIQWPVVTSQTFEPAQSASTFQLVLQMLPPHAYGAQDTGVTDEQPPLPSHIAATLAAPLLQTATAQVVEVSAYPAH